MLRCVNTLNPFPDILAADLSSVFMRGWMTLPLNKCTISPVGVPPWRQLWVSWDFWRNWKPSMQGQWWWWEVITCFCTMPCHEDWQQTFCTRKDVTSKNRFISSVLLSLYYTVNSQWEKLLEGNRTRLNISLHCEGKESKDWAGNPTPKTIQNIARGRLLELFFTVITEVFYCQNFDDLLQALWLLCTVSCASIWTATRFFLWLVLARYSFIWMWNDKWIWSGERQLRQLAALSDVEKTLLSGMNQQESISFPLTQGVQREREYT